MEVHKRGDVASLEAQDYLSYLVMDEDPGEVFAFIFHMCLPNGVCFVLLVHSHKLCSISRFHFQMVLSSNSGCNCRPYTRNGTHITCQRHVVVANL